ncbi:hypothetical protein ZOSMA_19G01080 [Zostera marina]|uniref:DUF220 domain-containing protein n=1 Tax=Zostera marina TaxID=29655 RepID=A0A0K9PQK5_ZOSMR|nr:hypothetical protein ZOSMA_19G01080 [Zostera marina]
MGQGPYASPINISPLLQSGKGRKNLSLEIYQDFFWGSNILNLLVFSISLNFGQRYLDLGDFMENQKPGNGVALTFNRAIDFWGHFPQRLHSYMKTWENRRKDDSLSTISQADKEYASIWNATLTKQLQRWNENPEWVDQPPKVKVDVPKGTLCNLSAEFNVGLPPDAIYNIFIDPGNKRVFKNIKRVVSRNVLFDDGLRQVVEVEQESIWKFLCWSGTFSVNLVVDQNRRNHTVNFKLVKSGFMKQFEGYWDLQPISVDEESETLTDYHRHTRRKGRVATVVRVDQLVQPSIIPPPPISWYVRGIMVKTIEMLINDLLAEAARVRKYSSNNQEEITLSNKISLDKEEEGVNLEGDPFYYFDGIKRKWNCRKRHRQTLSL